MPDRLPAWMVDGTPDWVVLCVDTFPPHASSRVTPVSPTPFATGLLAAIAEMAKNGVVHYTEPPQILRWAGWKWTPADGWEGP